MIDPTQIRLDKFLPLFRELAAVSQNQIYLAGGYALLLKQLDQAGSAGSSPNVIPLDRWRNPIARATKDFDIVLDPEVIAVVDINQGMLQVLASQHFRVSDDRTEKRWSFVHAQGTAEEISVDFLAQPPVRIDNRLRAEELRVKNKLSLGETGIHARTNVGAAGFQHRPYRLTIQGQPVLMVNPLTLCIMKLLAMADCDQRAQRELVPEKKQILLDECQKHARDLFRAVALMTREESDGIQEVVDAIHDAAVVNDAAQIFREYFQEFPAVGRTLVQDQWEPADYDTIIGILQGWFGNEVA